MIWVQFLGWALLVIISGIFIGRIIGALGERLKLGQVWAGTVLLSIVTTLPEMVTTSSVASRGAIGIALGNVIGSCIFNLFILVLMDFLSPPGVYSRVSMSHITTGLLGITLLALAICGISLGHVGLFGPAGPQIGFLGITSLLIIFIYAMGQFNIYAIAKKTFRETEPSFGSFWESKSTAILVFAFLCIALTIIVSAFQLGKAVESIANTYTLGATFAGATLLGIVTSLPEMTNAIASTRRGQQDLVVGNVLGANAFLILVLALVDIAFLKGAIFYKIGQSEAMSAIILAATAIIMQTIVLGAISTRNIQRFWKIGIVSSILIFFYVSSLILSYEFSIV